MFTEESKPPGEDIEQCLRDFQRLANAHAQVRRVMSLWERVVVVDVIGQSRRFFMRIANGEVSFGPPVDLTLTRNLVRVRATDSVLRDVFTGKRSAARAFFDADMEVFADERDQVKLESITMMLWGQ